MYRERDHAKTAAWLQIPLMFQTRITDHIFVHTFRSYCMVDVLHDNSATGTTLHGLK